MTFLCCIFLTSNAQADWQDHWIEGTKFYDLKNYESAKSEFNLAIAELEAQSDDTHPHVYVDRARIYLELDCNEESLKDIAKAINSEYLKKADRIRALATRILVATKMRNIDMCIADSEALEEIYPFCPEIEITKEKVIIRNFDQTECSKNLMRAFLICSGMCENDSDVVELNPELIIGYRKDCQCGCEDEYVLLGQQNNQQVIKQCKGWCDNAYFATNTWCGQKFSGRCSVACLTLSYGFYKTCNWCCDEGRKKCTDYFNAIKEYMAKEGCRVD